MTREHIIATRLQAASLVSLLGSVLDSLETVDATLARPTPHARDLDEIVLLEHLDMAAGTADALATAANEFALAVDAMHEARRAATQANITPFPAALQPKANTA